LQFEIERAVVASVMAALQRRLEELDFDGDVRRIPQQVAHQAMGKEV